MPCVWANVLFGELVSSSVMKITTRGSAHFLGMCFGIDSGVIVFACFLQPELHSSFGVLCQHGSGTFRIVFEAADLHSRFTCNPRVSGSGLLSGRHVLANVSFGLSQFLQAMLTQEHS